MSDYSKWDEYVKDKPELKEMIGELSKAIEWNHELMEKINYKIDTCNNNYAQLIRELINNKTIHP